MGKNRICELLGIRYPIVQAPMNWITGANLVAAVSQAGGLGTLGPNAGAKSVTPDVTLTGERLREQIKKVKSLTDKPFAVNIAIGVGEGRKFSQRCVEVVIEEHVPVVIASVGAPDVYTGVLKNAGVKVLHAISTSKHAKKAEDVGVDAVICEGFEAGGHKGFTELTNFSLIRMVSEAVKKVPIVAGGSICDTQGVLAALALGADGIYMGTRFMVTTESDAHPAVKEAIVKAEDACTISMPKDYMMVRDLRNKFTQEYMEKKATGASPEELREFLSKHSDYNAQIMGDCDNAEICCGQGAGLINSVISAGEVIRDIASGMPSVLKILERKASIFS